MNLNKNDLDKMNITSECIVINQCKENKFETYKNFKIYSYNEIGISNSRNRALEHASGDILLFCDDDVIYDNDYEKNSQGKKQFSEEECLNIALKFIKAKNIDMKHLKIDETSYQDYLYDGTYLFTFRHYVGDVRLGNSIRIYVTVYGDIVAYNEAIIFDVDELIESKIIESIDYKAAEEALKIKTDEIFGTGEATSLYEYEYLHSTKTLARVNGKYILSCQTYVDVTYKNNGSNVPGYSFISVIFLE
jgi:glycosyltransferase involved in cell wall biosynthesis